MADRFKIGILFEYHEIVISQILKYDEKINLHCVIFFTVRKLIFMFR